MSQAELSRDVPGPDGSAIPLVPAEEERENAPPWEQVEAGRYMPRRIRGSCRGRELG
jgi:hypothetical protein